MIKLVQADNGWQRLIMVMVDDQWYLQGRLMMVIDGWWLLIKLANDGELGETQIMITTRLITLFDG